MWSKRTLEVLHAGCEEVGVPTETAKELLKWLYVKKFAGSDGKNLSPSYTLDQLLHWILLNTHVRHQIEKLVGQIEHCTRTADLTDQAKVKRRLDSMNLMAEADWPPNVALWEEEGTIFTDIRPLSVIANPHYQSTYYGEQDLGPGEIKAEYYCEADWRQKYDDLVLNYGMHSCSKADEEFLDQKLKDHHSMLRAQGLKRLSHTSATAKGNAGQIYVKTLTCKTIGLEFPDRGIVTTRDIKEAIFIFERIPPNLQQVIFAGRELEDDVNFSRYCSNWSEGPPTLHLVLRLKGC